MKNLRKVTLAASTFAFAALFSFGWSGQSGVSLSIEKAEARVGRPLTRMSVAGVARRQHRRAAVGTAAAIGTVAAIGATAPYYTGAGYYAGSPYYSGAVREARAAYYGGYQPAAVTSDGGRPHYAVTAYHEGGPWYGYSGWDDYAARNSIKCKPGGTVKLDDGQMYVCQ